MSQQKYHMTVEMMKELSEQRINYPAQSREQAICRVAAAIYDLGIALAERIEAVEAKLDSLSTAE